MKVAVSTARRVATPCGGLPVVKLVAGCNQLGFPPGMALMSDADLDRMHELAGKLVPPWLNA